MPPRVPQLQENVDPGGDGDEDQAVAEGETESECEIDNHQCKKLAQNAKPPEPYDCMQPQAALGRLGADALPDLQLSLHHPGPSLLGRFPPDDAKQLAPKGLLAHIGRNS